MAMNNACDSVQTERHGGDAFMCAQRFNEGKEGTIEYGAKGRRCLFAAAIRTAIGCTQKSARRGPNRRDKQEPSLSPRTLEN